MVDLSGTIKDLREINSTVKGVGNIARSVGRTAQSVGRAAGEVTGADDEYRRVNANEEAAADNAETRALRARAAREAAEAQYERGGFNPYGGRGSDTNVAVRPGVGAPRVDQRDRFVQAVTLATAQPTPENIQRAKEWANSFGRHDDGLIHVRGSAQAGLNGKQVSVRFDQGDNYTDVEALIVATSRKVSSQLGLTPLTTQQIGGARRTSAAPEAPAPEAPQPALAADGAPATTAAAPTVAVLDPNADREMTARQQELAQLDARRQQEAGRTQAPAAGSPAATAPAPEAPAAPAPKVHAAAPAAKDPAQHAQNQKAQAVLESLGLNTGQKAGVVKGGDVEKYDGIIGPKSTEAIKTAQKGLGMEPTGKLTPELVAALSDPAKVTQLDRSVNPTKFAVHDAGVNQAHAAAPAKAETVAKAGHVATERAYNPFASAQFGGAKEQQVVDATQLQIDIEKARQNAAPQQVASYEFQPAPNFGQANGTNKGPLGRA